MTTVLVVLALVLVIATALPLLRLDQWWIRVLDFPRAQVTIAGIVLLAVYLYFWETQRIYESVVLGLLMLAVGYQAVKMFPYTVLMLRVLIPLALGFGPTRWALRCGVREEPIEVRLE